MHLNAETQDRTGVLQIFSLTLSQLSYRGLCCKGPLSASPVDTRSTKSEHRASVGKGSLFNQTQLRVRHSHSLVSGCTAMGARIRYSLAG